MSVHHARVSLTFFAFALSCGASLQAAERAPNVLLITADDLGL